MADERPFKAFAAQFEGRFLSGTDLVGDAADGERTATGQVEDDAVEGGGAECIFSGSRADGVETQAGEYVPGRKLAGVVVAAQSAGVLRYSVRMMSATAAWHFPGRPM